MTRQVSINRISRIIISIKKSWRSDFRSCLNNPTLFFAFPQFPCPPLISCSFFHVCQRQWQDIKVGTASRLQTVNIRWCSSLLAMNRLSQRGRTIWNLQPFSENASVLGVLLSSRKLRYQTIIRNGFSIFSNKTTFLLFLIFFFFFFTRKFIKEKNAFARYIFHTSRRMNMDFLL